MFSRTHTWYYSLGIPLYLCAVVFLVQITGWRVTWDLSRWMAQTMNSRKYVSKCIFKHKEPICGDLL